MKNEFNCKDIVITEQNTKALIISKDDENSILDTVIILPISSNILDDMFPYRLRIQNRDNLIDDSDVLINQITTLNKFKIKEKIAKLTQEEYDLVYKLFVKISNKLIKC